MQFVLSLFALFHLAFDLQVHLHYHKWQDFLLFMHDNISVCVYIHTSFICPLMDISFCFHILVTVSKIAVNMGGRVQYVFEILMSIPLDLYLEVGLLDCMVVHLLILKESS